MLEVEQALETILARAASVGTERVFLSEAHRRVLAEDIFAPIAVPPFDNSAVDGYAVIAADTAGASRETPVELQIIGEIMAGQTPTVPLQNGTAIRIMTGAPIPDNADAMIMVEDTELRETQAVAIYEAARCGQFVRRSGGDIQAGQLALERGTVLHAAELGVLASIGTAEISVYRLPRVAVVSTGDEIIDVGTSSALSPGKIWDSNRYTLAALVAEAGGILHSLTHIPDDYTATKQAFQHLASDDLGADIIVTAGGVSVGERDYVKPVLEELGQLELWRIAMKPGKPLAFGQIGKSLFFGLPGNPVSAMVTFDLFVRPVIQKMLGKTEINRPLVQATLTEDVSHESGRREYVRAQTVLENGMWKATPTGSQASNRLSSMAGANSLLVLPADTNDYATGAIIDCLLL